MVVEKVVEGKGGKKVKKKWKRGRGLLVCVLAWWVWETESETGTERGKGGSVEKEGIGFLGWETETER